MCYNNLYDLKFQELNNVIRSLFGEIRNEGTTQIQVNCPVCQNNDGLNSPDGKFNLEISYSKSKFRCWKCDDPTFSGSLQYLIKRVGSADDLAIFNEYYSIYSTEINKNNYDEDFEIIVNLPKEFINFKDMIEFLPSHNEALDYLLNDRKIPYEKIIKYGMGFCVDGYYGGRIIIPSYDKGGNLNYFIGRTYKKDVKPTYLNPKVDKTRIIFNESNINWDSTLYLFEGGFDLLAWDLNTAPLLGKTISNTLLDRIKQYKPNIVVLLDPDAYSNMIQLFEILYHIYTDESHKVRLVELTGKNDIDEIRRKFGEDMVIKVLTESNRQMTIDDYFRKKKTNFIKYNKMENAKN